MEDDNIKLSYYGVEKESTIKNYCWALIMAYRNFVKCMDGWEKFWSSGI